MSAFSDCVGETVSDFIPDDLGWWLVAVFIACLITGIIGGLASGGALIPVILAACLVIIGISFVGPALIGLVAGLAACARLLLP